MNSFKAFGTVPNFNTDSNEFSLRIKNSNELIEFFKTNQIDTKLTHIEGKASIKVRGKLASSCKPQNEVCLTIETFRRKDGMRIRGIDIQVLG